MSCSSFFLSVDGIQVSVTLLEVPPLPVLQDSIATVITIVPITPCETQKHTHQENVWTAKIHIDPHASVKHLYIFISATRIFFYDQGNMLGFDSNCPVREISLPAVQRTLRLVHRDRFPGFVSHMTLYLLLTFTAQLTFEEVTTLCVRLELGKEEKAFCTKEMTPFSCRRSKCRCRNLHTRAVVSVLRCHVGPEPTAVCVSMCFDVKVLSLETR